ncbi:hypothetical protein [Sphingobacterium yanglingense]|uniref:Uncharacterized protein n=1 Tax=Sphingobacterium yanglingense TaxID=1437280 RepID=A0A4R6WC10_9SPHI|nr:hypothetical protein [Sphingobacterium yanglingense]TDQ77075.1 hypothetical protein CLV99_2470 [Sphingobacterium yanglingense]
MELNKELLIERLSTKLELRGAFLYDYGIGEDAKEHLMANLKLLNTMS